MIILRQKLFDHLDELAKLPDGQKRIEEVLRDRNQMTLPPDPDGYVSTEKPTSKLHKNQRGSQKGTNVRKVPKNTYKYALIGSAVIATGYGVKKLYDRKKKKEKEGEKSFSTKERPSTKKDISRLSSGVVSGLIIGGAAGKFLDKQDKKMDISLHLSEHPEKAKELYKMTGGNKNLQRAVLDEVASVITPKTIRRVKKGAKIGAIGGGLLTGTNLVRKRYQKEYSEQLPSDWNDKDDKYIRLVEKGKKKSENLTNHFNRNRNLSYAGVGAAIGLVSGYKKGKLYKNPIRKNILPGKIKFSENHPELTRAASDSIKGGALGLSTSILGQHFTEITSNGKLSQENLKKSGEKDRKSADKALNKYRKLKTSKERKDFRKKLGLKF